MSAAATTIGTDSHAEITQPVPTSSELEAMRQLTADTACVVAYFKSSYFTREIGTEAGAVWIMRYDDIRRRLAASVAAGSGEE